MQVLLRRQRAIRGTLRLRGALPEQLTAVTVTTIAVAVVLARLFGRHLHSLVSSLA
jgi:hypothetical protein